MVLVVERGGPGTAHAESDSGRVIFQVLESPRNPKDAQPQGDKQHYGREVSRARYSSVIGSPLTLRDIRQVYSVLDGVEVEVDI